MENKVKKLKLYVEDILGFGFDPVQVPKQNLGNMPMFIGEMYQLYNATLFNLDLILIEYKDPETFSIFQLEKHENLLRNALHKRMVLLMDSITSFNRRRLIEKGINFIIPGKQLYLPDFLVDLRENFQNPRVKKKEEKLLPSAQYILLYHLLHRNENYKIEEISFTNLALRLDYTKMSITNAIEDLAHFDLCTIEGTREKYIRFHYDRVELWNKSLPYLVNPVLKRMYVDQLPEGLLLMPSNESALSEYSDMNPSRQEYFAIEKMLFYELQKQGKFINPNPYEGHYCLELWKYNPIKLANGISEKNNVDPLSLYLSLHDLYDERVQHALKMIIEKYIW